MKALETPKTHIQGVVRTYDLRDQTFPFLLYFAQVKLVQPLTPTIAEKTDSDGQTSGDGEKPGAEDFDWLKDD
jgi:hypothetical protein